ncbi:MAG: nucleoside-diphosphate kinase [Elusimicrobiota bacterium]
MEQTLILIKPDGARRKLTGLVIDRFDASGLELVGAKMTVVTEELAREHYRSHEGQPYFPSLVRFLRGEFHGFKDHRVMALVYRGEDAVARARVVVGATHPEQAAPGSIRGSFGRMTTDGRYENVVHASSDAVDAAREVSLWFKPGEVLPG